ncbi:MAG TPA: class I SAM-dependent methyltransferase [bacterium]|nr:class I SAM-dependent methyltransferase [bacterium]
MSSPEKRAYFDSIADKWDGWEDLVALPGRLREGLSALGVRPGETVIDLGCGTGNLTAVLVEMVGERGCVIGVDFSPVMLARAQTKLSLPRVRWLCEEAHRLSVDAQSVDRVVCFSAWPHFDEPLRVAGEIFRLLKPGGHAHIWHLAGREVINEVHCGQGEPIGRDWLPPAVEVAQLLRDVGFLIERIVDETKSYLVSVIRP